MSEIDRIRTAIAAIKEDAPDDEVNRLCALAFGWEHKECCDFSKYTMWSRGGFSTEHLPHYTASIAAIKAEMPVGWKSMGANISEGYVTEIYYPEEWPFQVWGSGQHVSPQKSLLLALLYAMEAQNA